MENQANKKEKKVVERIVVNDENLKKIDAWIGTVTQKKNGLKLKRKDVVNWLIAITPDNLPANLEKKLIELFYDEEMLLKEALKAIQKAKKNGQSLSLKEYFQDAKPKIKYERSKTEKKQDSGSQENSV